MVTTVGSEVGAATEVNASDNGEAEQGTYRNITPSDTTTSSDRLSVISG